MDEKKYLLDRIKHNKNKRDNLKTAMVIVNFIFLPTLLLASAVFFNNIYIMSQFVAMFAVSLFIADLSVYMYIERLVKVNHKLRRKLKNLC